MPSTYKGYENDTPAESAGWVWFAGDTATFRARAYSDQSETKTSTQVSTVTVALTHGDGTAATPTPTRSGEVWSFSVTLTAGTTVAIWTFTDASGNIKKKANYVNTAD